jgi:NADH:ubiquinone oxidoreductase subunit F (NADH-binding)
MLHDRDRIFTNLYGEQPWNLEGARGRGDWDGTKDLILKGREWLGPAVQGLRPARPRRRRLPDRREVVVHAKQANGPVYLVVNADESEPGTCKDREIMRHDRISWSRAA